MSPAAIPFSSGTGGSAKPGHAVLASLSHRNNSGSAEKCQVTLVILPVARKELPGRTLAYLTTRCADQKFPGIWRAECMESPGSQRNRPESRGIGNAAVVRRAAPVLPTESRYQTVHDSGRFRCDSAAIPAMSAPS